MDFFYYVPWGLGIMLIKFFAQETNKYVKKWLFSTLILTLSKTEVSKLGPGGRCPAEFSSNPN